MHNQDIERYLQRRMIFYLDYLRAMVEINSYTLNKEGIDELSEITAEPFRELGFEMKTEPSSDNRYGSHLVLEKQGETELTVAFISHLDTVYSPDEEAENDFRWKIEEDKVYGPGTVDIKGGTMMIYMLMDLLREFHGELFNRFSFKILLDCAEEVGGADFGDLCSRELNPSATLACLVFEGSNIKGDIHHQVVSRKGMATYTIEVKGRSAHSGTAHEKGANAIVQMARIVDKVSSLTDYDKRLTVNTGRIEGGSVRNRVADHCRLELEMRAVELDSYNRAIGIIDNLDDLPAVKSPYDSWSCLTSVEREITTPPWEENERTDSLFDYWKRAAEKLGYSMNREIRGGLSDGNLLWQEYPVMDGLGPGGDNSHCSEQNPQEGKEQEYMSLSSVEPVAMINFTGLVELLSDNG